MHYYQFNIADYQSHTKHLTPIEDICYRRLLDWQYMHEKPISSDINSVCRLLMLRDYSTDVEQVLSEFFTLTESGWVNNRAFEEIEQFRDKSKKASEAGKASAAKRSLKNESANNQQHTREKEHSLNDRSTNVQPTINQEPLTIKPSKEKIIKKEIDPGLKKLLHDVDDQVIKDFSVLRKQKKAPVTESAVNGLRREAAIAGIDLQTALIECCKNGWQGFKAEWYQKAQAPPVYQTRQQIASVAARSVFGNNNEKCIDGEVIGYESTAKQLG